MPFIFVFLYKEWQSDIETGFHLTAGKKVQHHAIFSTGLVLTQDNQSFAIQNNQECSRYCYYLTQYKMFLTVSTTEMSINKKKCDFHFQVSK